MSTRDQRALFYDLVGTLWETKVFEFRGKYSCKAESPYVHHHAVATGKQPLQPLGVLANGQGGCKVCGKFRQPNDLTCSSLTAVVGSPVISSEK